MHEPLVRIFPILTNCRPNNNKPAIMWNILSRDYNKRLSGKRCAKNVIPHMEPGDIIVFHDSVKCAKNLWVALPLVLEAIKEKGLVCKKIEL